VRLHEDLKVYITKNPTIPGATAPTKSHENDAGWDLYVSRDCSVLPRSALDVPTDISIAFPRGWYGQIVGRSSTKRNYGLEVITGVVDSGYRGELFIQTYNPTDKVVNLGLRFRIAQILFLPVPDVEWIEVDNLPASLRGSRGFGSSGR
jgi:dUTP pyrophosphatase